jgi:hypothetical protein
MNKTNSRVDRTKRGLGIALLAALTGCVGYVDTGYRGAVVVVPEPDVYVFGGYYEGGVYVHDYGRRGYESRGRAHSEGREREGRR